MDSANACQDFLVLIAVLFAALVHNAFMTKKTTASWTAMTAQETVFVMTGNANVTTASKERLVVRSHALMIALSMAPASCVLAKVQYATVIQDLQL